MERKTIASPRLFAPLVSGKPSAYDDSNDQIFGIIQVAVVGFFSDLDDSS